MLVLLKLRFLGFFLENQQNVSKFSYEYLLEIDLLGTNDWGS